MKRHTDHQKSPKTWRWFLFVAAALVTCLAAMACGVALAFFVQINRDLPSVENLKIHEPAVGSTVYAADGTLIAEYYDERRYPVPIEDMPKYLINAFLAAEDARFYQHGGVDFLGIIRAAIINVRAGEIVQGGSTITQQVVKSLLLTPERTYIRKVKEAILAYRIGNYLSKDRILYLYLNQIFFGSGAYGVEAASRIYFDKHVSELTLAEAAMLAGLPKAPSRYSPLHNLELAKERQSYVIRRMVEENFISADDATRALSQRLQFARRQRWTPDRLNSFAEEVRREVERRHGRDTLYREGLKIYTTFDVSAQRFAESAVDRGLRELDKRRARYRGPQKHVDEANWTAEIQRLRDDNPLPLEGRTVEALVTEVDSDAGTATLKMGSYAGTLPPDGYKWVRMGSRKLGNVLRPGDVIEARLEEMQPDYSWTITLDQPPAVQGAFLAIDPVTGRTLCMVGGADFASSQFNRVVQSRRQPGSAFKPFVYATAIERGYTPASILIDSPILKEDPSLEGMWKPSNYDHKFLGPIALKTALKKSRNVVTIKLLSQIGISNVIEFAHRLGIQSDLTPTLSLALGASDLSLWELVPSYAAFANGGYKVEPYLIEKITDRHGNAIEEHQPVRTPVISPQVAYVMTDILQAVITEGTGVRVRSINRPAAGKTGTTNDLRDAWFIGYTPDTLAGAWVGHDDHRIPLGSRETGGKAASPIWLYFMEEWLKDKPVASFDVPPGIVFARVNPNTGTLAGAGDEDAPTMPFVEGNLPPRYQQAEGGTRHVLSDDKSFFKSDLF